MKQKELLREEKGSLWTFIDIKDLADLLNNGTYSANPRNTFDLDQTKSMRGVGVVNGLSFTRNPNLDYLHREVALELDWDTLRQKGFVSQAIHSNNFKHAKVVPPMTTGRGFGTNSSTHSKHAENTPKENTPWAEELVYSKNKSTTTLQLSDIKSIHIKNDDGVKFALGNYLNDESYQTLETLYKSGKVKFNGPKLNKKGHPIGKPRTVDSTMDQSSKTASSAFKSHKEIETNAKSENLKKLQGLVTTLKHHPGVQQKLAGAVTKGLIKRSATSAVAGSTSGGAGTLIINIVGIAMDVIMAIKDDPEAIQLAKEILKVAKEISPSATEQGQFQYKNNQQNIGPKF